MNDDGSIPLQVLSAVTQSNNNIILQILLIVILTALNAFFASAEIALLSVNDAKLRKLADKGDKKAASLLKFIENSSKFLSTIQVGVTFSGFLSSAFASNTFAELIVNAIVSAQPSMLPYADTISTLAVIVVTLVLSYFTLVFGELVPKRLAMKKGEKLAMRALGPLKFTQKIFAPFVWLLTISVNGVLRLMGINPNAEEDNVTEEEILLMVNEGQEKGVIGDDEGEMISNIFDFNDKTAGEVMTHRTEICAVRDTDPFEIIMDVACKERYSRIPVYNENIDNIIGIIHIKDLLRAQTSSFNLNEISRQPCFVPESQKIDDVFNTLKENHSHMAVVVDEYGGTAGIITMEDILEELVGNIRDEYDDAEVSENKIEQLSETEYQIDGLAAIDDINDMLRAEIPSDEYETLSGFVISILGEIPEEDEHPEFTYEGLRFTVLESNEKIITSVLVEILPPPSSHEEVQEDSDEDIRTVKSES